MTPLLQAQLVDITTLQVDAIVNAANPALAAGGGVCGAIHAAAGPELEAACRRVAPCPTGEARITPGFRLPARFVIHAVGPIWYGGDSHEAEDLATAIEAVTLALATPGSVESVLFACFSEEVLAAYRRAGSLCRIVSSPRPPN